MGLVLTDAMESIPLCTSPGYGDPGRALPSARQLLLEGGPGGILMHIPPLCFHPSNIPGIPGTGAFTPAGIAVLWHCLCQGQLDQRGCSRWI